MAAKRLLALAATSLLLLQTTYGLPRSVHDTNLRPSHEIVDNDNDLQTPFLSSIPSRYESTVLARRMLSLSSAAYITTTFPHHPSSDRVPTAAYDTPIALPDYIASCEEPSGNPTILALTLSTFVQNALQGSNVSLALSWWDEYVKHTGREPWSKANLPRMSLLGRLEEMNEEEVEKGGVVSCFTRMHGDSRLWLPGSKTSPHAGKWVRLVVEEVYWLGGFGDRNYIGWLDPEEWRVVTVEEYSAVRLPGES